MQMMASTLRQPGSQSGHPLHLAYFLLSYGVMMFAFALVARGWGPLHADMTEAWAWGKEFQLGYGKHPPVFAWIAGAWFQVMPRTNWSFHLLSIINAGVGLAGVWMLAGLFLGVHGRWAAVLFLVLTPSYTLWALKFNANSVLLSLWPWTAYCFLQSLRTGSIPYALLAGLAGGLALLSKYYSVILLATLFLVAVLHPNCVRYFRSAAPYITAAFGLVLIAPHVWWLVRTHFPTFSYALLKMQYPAAEAREHALIAVIVSYLCLGAGVLALAVAFGEQFRSRCNRALRATCQPQTAWMIWLAHGPLLLTAAAYFVTNVRITGQYLMPAFFAMPVAFLSCSGPEIPARVVKRLAYCATVVWAFILLSSPILASYAFAYANVQSLEPRKEIALAITEFWHTTFGRPLRYVAGTERLATAAAFYSSDAPSYLMIGDPSLSPWVATKQATQEGVFIACCISDQECLKRARQFVGESPFHFTREFSASFFGKPTTPQTFAFFILPPRNVQYPQPLDRLF
jgi:4-amino-4-deoxy-L-arabinose transferase-like glycosyltransferase